MAAVRERPALVQRGVAAMTTDERNLRPSGRLMRQPKAKRTGTKVEPILDFEVCVVRS